MMNNKVNRITCNSNLNLNHNHMPKKLIKKKIEDIP